MAGGAGDFKRDLKHIVQLVGQKSKRLVQAVGVTVFNEVQTGGNHSPGTPIDKGFHRGAWQCELNGTAEGAYSESRRPEDAQGGALASIGSMEPGDTLEMANNGPGIRKLEFDGWSPQAPNGFVRPAAEAFEQIVDEVAAHIASEG